ncbi:hypothetical protein [Microbacterium sp.]|uniref:hypothetical protein n=1 Tax=Microbacterium sp. TaxID=51671 RepID=UPI0039E62311
MPPRKTGAVVAAALALALVLGGCVPEPAPSPSGSAPQPSPSSPGASTAPAPTPSGTPTPAPTPTPTSSPTTAPAPTPTTSPGAAAPVIIPKCATLLPLSTVHALFGDAAEPIDVSGSPADHMPGPLAAATVRGARQATMCTWAIPFSDGGFTVITAEISGSAREKLVAGLRSSSRYTERSLDGQVSFSQHSESDLGTTSTVYVFVGNVWITVDGTLSVKTAREFAGSAADAIRSANA